MSMSQELIRNMSRSFIDNMRDHLEPRLISLSNKYDWSSEEIHDVVNLLSSTIDLANSLTSDLCMDAMRAGAASVGKRI